MGFSMTAAYWKQWSRAELLSWQGVEPDDYQDEDAEYSDEEQECTCSDVCMKCLGMSWADFM
jgi:hypothetical protein